MSDTICPTTPAILNLTINKQINSKEDAMVKNVTVYLDTGKMEFTDRVRCGFIVSENEDGNETFHNDLIDQSEYPTIKELIDDIVGIFHVSKQNVMVTM